MAAVWSDIRKTGGGEFRWDGVQHSDTILHAPLRHNEHRLFPVAYEQRSWIHDVPSILRLRCGIPYVRIRDTGLSRLI